MSSSRGRAIVCAALFLVLCSAVLISQIGSGATPRLRLKWLGGAGPVHTTINDFGLWKRQDITEDFMVEAPFDAVRAAVAKEVPVMARSSSTRSQHGTTFVSASLDGSTVEVHKGAGALGKSHLSSTPSTPGSRYRDGEWTMIRIRRIGQRGFVSRLIDMGLLPAGWR